MTEMPPTLTDARQLRTRNNLLQAMLRLLEQGPFDQVTIRAIAQEAGIGYATFFRHYPSKEALLHDLAADEIRDLLERTMPLHNMGDNRESCRALISYVDENRKLWSALLTGGAAGLVKQEFIEQAKRLTEEFRGSIQKFPHELLTVYSTSAVVEIIAWWLQQGTQIEANRVADFLNEMVIEPVIKNGEMTF